MDVKKISNYVQGELERSFSFAEGEIEIISSELDNTIKALSMLIGFLHSKGLVTKEDIRSIVGSYGDIE